MKTGTAIAIALVLALLLALALALAGPTAQGAQAAQGGAECAQGAPKIPFVALCERESRIFVSIASYRDTLYESELEQLLELEAYLSRLVGIMR